jgi:iron complex transport system ATP-binding protein
MIAAERIGVTVGRFRILDRVSLGVGPGELVAVIGPNGAGKSTLLRTLAGDATPAEGRVLLGATPIAEMDPQTRSLRRSVLPQGGPTDVPFTVWEVVMMGRHPHRRDPKNSAAADAAAVTESLRHTDAGHLAERRFSTLSGGEQTRVSLARVFAQDTPILLLDEPTTALDIGHETLVMADLARVAAAGRTVVTVLHDLNAAARHATRIVAMDAGTTVADGSPHEVLTEDLLSHIYRHPLRVIAHPLEDCPLVLPT